MVLAAQEGEKNRAYPIWERVLPRVTPIPRKKKTPETLDFSTFPTISAPCGRWGEADTEKGPVDLFPAEPTDEAFQAEETLNLGSRPPRHEKAQVFRPGLFSCGRWDFLRRTLKTLRFMPFCPRFAPETTSQATIYIRSGIRFIITQAFYYYRNWITCTINHTL